MVGDPNLIDMDDLYDAQQRRRIDDLLAENKRLRELLRQSETEWGAEAERLRGVLRKEASRVWYPNSYTAFKALVRDGASAALEQPT